jgi:hypothetical protein
MSFDFRRNLFRSEYRPNVPLPLPAANSTLHEMLKYQKYVGKSVEAHYRAGDLQLSVSGILAADSGKSVFVEDRFVQHGKEKTLRVEIPYQYLSYIDERPERPAETRPPSKTPVLS